MKILLRRAVQACFFLFFLILFLQARFPYSPVISSDAFLRFSPLLPIWSAANGGVNLGAFLPAILILGLTVIAGRFFCGWICPLGTLLDAFAKVHPIPLLRQRVASPSGSLRYWIFGLCLILALGSVPVWCYFDPLCIMERTSTGLLFPFTTMILELLLSPLKGIPVFSALPGLFKTWIMPEAQSFPASLWIIIVLFGSILALEILVVRRAWCRFVCPAGTLLGLLSRWPLLGRNVHKSCVNCGRCSTSCKMGAIPRGRVETTDTGLCIQCLACEPSCPLPEPAISFGLGANEVESLDLSRRELIHISLAGATLGVMNRLALENPSDQAEYLRPPGAVPEKEFLNRCLRCLACVRICQSNGRCLQPAPLLPRPLNALTPVALMRTGCCEYNCNLCGHVCPTQAISPLTVEAKQKCSMGLACFEKNLCIPHARHQDCLVCEEHCPVPDKAIKFELQQVEAREGGSKTVKLPYVVKELCIGCGICEQKCPLKGKPGIFVTPENASRVLGKPSRSGS